MLKSLALRGFRAFESYELAELATVNLLVGKNNCGKTSLLEAVELLVSNGHLSVFSEVAQRHDEGISYRRRHEVNASHLFFGHTCEPGACFKLSSDDGRELSATILSLDEVGEDADLWETRRNRERRRELDEDEEIVPAFGLRIALGAAEEAVALPMAEDGTILHDFWRRDHLCAMASPRPRFAFSGWNPLHPSVWETHGTEFLLTALRVKSRKTCAFSCRKSTRFTF